MDLVDAAKAGISLEGAGIVRNIGADVENLKVGDRVIIFEHGCFSTRLAISAKLCASIPDELSFEEAATLPCVYSTVIYLLLTIGGLQQGQASVRLTQFIQTVMLTDQSRQCLFILPAAVLA